MLWFVIISLLLFGLALLVLEIVFIPGTTVVGVVGVCFSIAGVLTSYSQFGSAVGFYVLLTTLVTTGITLYFCFRSDAWRTFALKSTMKNKVNEGWMLDLKVGDDGFAVSALRPSGKGEFRQQQFEVRTRGAFVEPGKKIRIILIENNQIIVEELT
jgi:membrane-bound ClpP family serine protease